MANEQKTITIQTDPSMIKGAYSNMAQVQHTGEEFVLDFFTVIPPTGSLSARIILSPSHYKRLFRAMEENLKRYEQEYGTIQLEVRPDQKIDFK